jgi:hypothetical protein
VVPDEGTGVSGHTSWRQLKADTNELGPRAARAIHAEGQVSRSRNAEHMMGLLLAKRIRARNVREGVMNNDTRDLPAVSLPQRKVGQAGPARFNRLAGGGSL